MLLVARRLTWKIIMLPSRLATGLDPQLKRKNKNPPQRLQTVKRGTNVSYPPTRAGIPPLLEIRPELFLLEFYWGT